MFPLSFSPPLSSRRRYGRSSLWNALLISAYLSNQVSIHRVMDVSSEILLLFVSNACPLLQNKYHQQFLAFCRMHYVLNDELYIFIVFQFSPTFFCIQVLHRNMCLTVSGHRTLSAVMITGSAMRYRYFGCSRLKSFRIHLPMTVFPDVATTFFASFFGIRSTTMIFKRTRPFKIPAAT